MLIHFILPVRSFAHGYERLASVLSDGERAELAIEVFEHVTGVLAQFGAISVVTADGAARELAHYRGYEVVADPGSGLNDAAMTGTLATEGPWCVVHGDLPHVSETDLGDLLAAAESGTVLCPTHDGGTSVVASVGEFSFAYGQASFRRHLAGAKYPVTVLVRRGFALDLDTPRDLVRYREGSLAL